MHWFHRLGPSVLPVLLCLQTAPTSPPASQNADANNTAAITGSVVDGAIGTPIAGALVYLTATPALPPVGVQTRQLTDEKGRFAFVNLPGNTTYTIATSKFGFLDGGYGRDSDPTDALRTLTLKAGEWVSNVRATIWRPGSVSGVIRDESGEPVVGVFVRALVKLRIQGRDDLAGGPLTLTNDRGEYRLSGLGPGRYLIQVPSVRATVPSSTKFAVSPGRATDEVMDIDDSTRLVIGRYPLPPPPAGGRAMTYPVVFHPSSTTAAQAGVIDLKFADDRANIDLTLVPVPSVRISGVVEGPVEALKSLTLRLLPIGLENLGLGAEAATALVEGDGRFTFPHVPAGSYTIDAPVRINELTTSPGNFFSPAAQFPVPPPAQGYGRSSGGVDLIPGISYSSTTFRGSPAEYSGRATVTAGSSDVTGVVVRLRPHVTVSGQIVLEPDPTKEVKPPARVPVRLDPASGESRLGTPQSQIQQSAPADQFRIAGVPPGEFWVRPFATGAWIMKSAVWRGRNLALMPLDTASADEFSGVVVTMTNAVPELTGAVHGTDDDKTAVVVIFPVEQAQWRNTGLWPARMKTAPVTSHNTYRIASVPAGDYYVAAIGRADRQRWRELEYLTGLARVASRVTLSWGGKVSLDLTLR